MAEVGSTKNRDFDFVVSVNVNNKGKWGRRILCSYVEDDDRGTLRRSLEKKGFKPHHIFMFSRQAEPDEVYRQYEVMYRIPFIMYDDWDKLIADEKKYTNNESWFTTLEEYKQLYPEFINLTLQAL